MQMVDVATVLSGQLLHDQPRATGDEAFDRCWAKVSHYAMLDVFRAKRIWDLALEASTLAGDFIECGAFRGATSCLLGLLIEELGLDKRVYVLDSFAGLPEPDPRHDEPHFRAGMLASDLEQCRARIRALALDDVAIVLPGWFHDTLPRLPAAATYSLIHVDCDLYTSTKLCLDALHPRATEHAPVVFDDYLIQSPGERAAARELVARTGETLELGPCTQAYLRKGRCYTPRVSVAGPGGQVLSCDDLVSNEAYLEWVEHTAAQLRWSAASVAELALALR